MQTYKLREKKIKRYGNVFCYEKYENNLHSYVLTLSVYVDDHQLLLKQWRKTLPI
jgi:hypothetical protein